MNFITEWWNAMNILQQSFAVVAIPATVMLLLQTVMLLFGIGGSHDGETDGDAAVEHGDFSDNLDIADDGDFTDGVHIDDGDQSYANHHDAGLRLFTVRGIVAFFSVGGWLGVVLGETSLHTAWVILISLLGGLISLIVTALILKWSLKLQDEGNIDIRNALGKTAQVYIPIPANGKSFGKVTLVLQDRYVEYSAITQHSETLKTDSFVKITGIINQSTLVVKPIAEE
ncbi:MAG: hypothetical protein E7551_02600 [Ruminococcaceae bacterium]|nr:hypothetical protein [Oscillospiraceae bacterium]